MNGSAPVILREEEKAGRDGLSSTENEILDWRTLSSTRWRCSYSACILNQFLLTKTYQPIRRLSGRTRLLMTRKFVHFLLLRASFSKSRPNSAHNSIASDFTPNIAYLHKCVNMWAFKRKPLNFYATSAAYSLLVLRG